MRTSRTGTPIRTNRRKASAGRRSGFTLVELLVVISIIAVLLTILLPSLQAAKQQAQGVLCVAHLRSLSMVWTMYADDNEGRMVGGCASYLPGPPGYPWVVAPLNKWGWSKPNGTRSVDGSGGDAVTLEDRLRGIRAGALFAYTDNNTDIYHCPGDKRMYEGTYLGDTLVHQLYRSYTIQLGLNGGPPKALKRVSSIKQPEEMYVFVEEYYDGGVFNAAWGFNLDPINWPGGWWSTVAVWHNDSSTLGFADGHAERKVWQDERTIDLAYCRSTEGWYQPDNLDLQYLMQRYAIQGDLKWYEW